MIAIKNAIVPSSCYFCPMTNDGFYLCKANNPYRQLEDDCEERRPSWCPLVPVPTHGRLIDEKALTKDLEKRWNVNDDHDFCNKEVWHALREAPTIIEAEEGEI